MHLIHWLICEQVLLRDGVRGGLRLDDVGGRLVSEAARRGPGADRDAGLRGRGAVRLLSEIAVRDRVEINQCVGS